DRTTVPVGQSVTVTVTGLTATGDEAGDVTDRTELVIGPTGTCTGPTCTSTATGKHTVKGTLDGISGSTVVTFVSGPVARLDVTPSTSTVNAGDQVAFAAHAFDSFGNAIGDVTGGTTFAMGPDGTCAGHSCSATVAGSHTVTVVN